VLRNCTLVVALLALAFIHSAGAGERSLTLMLDWTPNPDHVGLYYARDAGLFARNGLRVVIHAPSDPTTPLKLVALGRTDLAISYEQEVFFAAAKKLPIVTVAAVVPQPLNSIIAIDPKIHSVHDLTGRTIGVTGVPSDYASLDTALASAGLTRKDVRVITVGYNLLPALLSHKVDAVIGVYRNVEGVELRQRGLRPTIIPLDRAGVPFYDELVLVANASRLRSDPAYKQAVRDFVGAFLAGTTQARFHPSHALAILEKVTSANRTFLARSTAATLPLLSGPNGIGCLRKAQWARFGAWLHSRSLLARPVAASTVMTNEFLPARCR